MRVFGLTGGIATGKSTVAARWRQRGLPVIDADALARLAVAPGSDGLAEVAQLLGREVLSPDGNLDRALVAAKVFSDPGARRALEGIIHPRVHAALGTELSSLAAQGHRIACYEAPLLVELGKQDSYRPLVVVSASQELQLQRAQERNGTTKAALQARIAAQLPLAAKEAVADYVIANDASRQALFRRADQVLDAVCRRFGVDPAELTPV